MQRLNTRTKDLGVETAEAKGDQYFSETVGKVELHRLTAAHGIDRIDLRDMDSDAMTVKRPDGRFTLFLNSSQPRIRHRFSVAHELAHLLLTPILGERTVHRRRFSKNQDPFGDQIEYLCNDMASAILMPSSHVQEILNDNQQSARCVPRIARSLDTSFEAAARRFVRLSQGRCGLVVWTKSASGAIRYSRPTIWNKSLGYCTLQLDARQLSTALRGFDKHALRFISSKEEIILTRGRGVRSTTQMVHHVPVESFVRIDRGQFQCWSFINLDYQN